MLNGTIVGGSCATSPGGMDGGGWVSGIDMAPDGWMTVRTDTGDAYVRDQGATSTWRALWKPGVTYPGANQLYNNPAQRTYAICIAYSNSSILYSSTLGRLWKTTDRGLNWTLLTGFKSNVVDTGMSYNVIGGSRIGGQHMRISPTVPNNVGFCHPVDGFYYTTDGGTTWTLSGSIPAPTDTTGGNVYFVSDTDVWVVMKGRGTYHSTTGVGGTFSLVSGGPTVCGSISGGGGKVYFVGINLADNDGQLYVWNGTTFSQPAGVTGTAVAVNPSLTSKVVVMTVGGAFWTSTDTGATWTNTTVTPSYIAHDSPHLGYIANAYFALGAIAYHPTVDRIIATMGIGVWQLDTPPLTGGTNWLSISKGVRNMLCNSVRSTPSGKVLVCVQDRAAYGYTRANVFRQASVNYPTLEKFRLRQADTIDYARDDENYLALTYSAQGGGNNGAVSTDGGATWAYMPTIPTFTSPGNGVIPFIAGNIAVSNKLNMLWVSTSNWGVGAQNGVKYTTDGGTTWSVPNFGGVSMTDAFWHSAYYVQREIAQAYKGTAGVFYLWCNGTDGSNSTADLACRGLWKSTDGGANFTKTAKTTPFNSFTVDQYALKIKLNNSRAGHFFTTPGGSGNYPSPPAVLPIQFSPDDGATMYSLTGWSAPDDIAIGAKAYSGQTYETLYALGYRSSTYGLYRCLDFNPANPTACTWQLQEQWPMSRPDNSNTLAADQSVFGRGVIGFAQGGVGVFDNIDIAHAT